MLEEMNDPSGMTAHVYVTDIQAAEAWYTHLFGRGPDFVPEPDTREWETAPGVWLLVGRVDRPEERSGRIRFQVRDVERACKEAERVLGVPVTAPDTLVGTVRWCNFEDCWGNRLGFFEDLQSGVSEARADHDMSSSGRRDLRGG